VTRFTYLFSCRHDKSGRRCCCCCSMFTGQRDSVKIIQNKKAKKTKKSATIPQTTEGMLTSL